MSSYSKRSDIPVSTTNKIEAYTKYFQLPLPFFKFSHKSPSKVYTLVQESLIQHNEKAKKLSEITKNLLLLCENYNRNLKALEVFKEAAAGKIELFEAEIEEKQEELEIFSQKLLNMNNYTEDIEKSYRLLLSERDILKQDLTLNKQNAKLIENRLQEELDEEKIKNSIKLEEYKRRLEEMKFELLNKNKYIQDLVMEKETLENQLDGEISRNQRIEEELKEKREAIFVLKNKLSEKRLKKKKKLGKETLSFAEDNKNKFNGVPNCEGIDIIGQRVANDLMELEQEQLLDSESNVVNLEIIDDFQASEVFAKGYERRSTIFLLPNNNDARLGIENCGNAEILPFKVKKNLGVYAGNTVSCIPAKKLIKRKLRTAYRSFPANRLNYSYQRGIIEMHHSLSKQMNKRKLNMETWTDSVNTIKLSQSNILETNITTESSDTYTEPTPKDPIKDYFIKLCHSIKSNCCSEKILQVPTQSLYNNLIQLKIPLCNWPENIKLYLYKRLR